MGRLKAIAEELRRQRPVTLSCDDHGATITLDGDDIFVDEDVEHDRIVLWAEMGSNLQGSSRAAAEAVVKYNEEFITRNVATLGYCPDADHAVLGRSFDFVDFDASRLFDEARNFKLELVAAKAYFESALAEARAASIDLAPAFDQLPDTYVRI